MTEEIWKDIPGYEGQYLASNIGRIKSMVSKKPGLIRKQDIRRDGYAQVQLKVDQRPVNFLVHRLVDLAFNGPIHDGLVINHLDGTKANNVLSNLERCTSSQNVRHAIGLGLKPPARGESHGMAKLTDADVREIREIAKVRTPKGRIPRGVLACLCVRFGIGYSAMGAIIRGEHWSHIQ